MATGGLRQITVWLDELAPGQGTFAHALEWATMLHLPLRGLVSVGRNRWPLPAETIAACESACAWSGVSWSWAHEDPDRHEDRDGENGLSSNLLVIGGAMPVSINRRLFRDAVNRPQVGPLVCPRSWEYLRRPLVINEGRTRGQGFLEAAVRICHDVAQPAVVLTVARFDEDARSRQQLAEEVFAAHGVKADFHVVVGGDFYSGVSVVANWRRCSHVFVEKISVSSVQRWLGRNVSDHIFEWSDSFAFLPIPAAALDRGPATNDFGRQPDSSAAAPARHH